MAQPTNEVKIGPIGGSLISYRLAEENGERLWNVERVSATPEEQAAAEGRPDRMVLALGQWGMGASTENGVRNQYHYSLDIDTWTEPGVLGPAPRWTAVFSGGGTGQVIKFVQAVDQNGRRLVYAVGAGGNNIVKKINLDATTPTNIGAASKAFTHGGGGTKLTDLVVCKAGVVAYADAGRYTTPVGDAYMIAAFGDTAPLQQCNTFDVTDATTDTWTGVAASAYGGVLATAPGASSGEINVWKSSPFGGVTGAGPYVPQGAFSKLKYKAMSSANTDFSNETTWSPSSPANGFQAGDAHSAIASLFEFGRSVMAVKPEGAYNFDQNGNSYADMTLRSYGADDDGRHARAVLGSYFVPMADGLASPAVGGLLGLQSRVDRPFSNLSPVLGECTAVTPYGDAFFAAFYDGVDSYICLFVPKGSANVPQPFLVYPVHKFASLKTTALLVATSTAKRTWLFAGAGGDVYAAQLSQRANRQPPGRTYESGGVWYSTYYVFPEASRTFERIVLYTEGCDASNYLVLSWSVDGVVFTNVPNITTNGPQVITLSPTGSPAPTGSAFQLKIATVVASPYTARPRVRMPVNPTTGQPGGIIVEGQIRPELRTDRLVFGLVTGAQTASAVLTNSEVTFDTLAAFEKGRPVQMQYLDYETGSGGLFYATITSVSYAEKRGDAEQSSERYVKVIARRVPG